LSELCDIVLESLLQLRCGNGAHRNREILLLHVTLGARDNHFFQRRCGDLVIILGHCRQHLRSDGHCERQRHFASGKPPEWGFGRHGMFLLYFFVVYCRVTSVSPQFQRLAERQQVSEYC
jgi:hypothetical protein